MMVRSLLAMNLDAAAVAGKPAYVIIYGDGCYNPKRQARRMVSLYEWCKERGEPGRMAGKRSRERNQWRSHSNVRGTMKNV